MDETPLMDEADQLSRLTALLEGSPTASEWALRARQCLAFGNKEFLAQAISSAPVDPPVAHFLRAFDRQEFQTLNQLAEHLTPQLLQACLPQDALTIELLCLFPRVTLAERFQHYPCEQQGQALRSGVAAAQMSVTLARALADAPCVAVFKLVIGNAMADARQLDEAHAAFYEALTLYRTLVQTQPEVFQPRLAMTLNNLGNVLRDLRRLDEAHVTFNEALEIRRRLAETQSDVFAPAVAETLNNLGNVLSDLRQGDEALAAFNESLEMRRRLAASQPEAFAPEVAMSLNNLGNALNAARRLEAAQVAYSEALLRYRQLAVAQPDRFESDVAMSLNNLGIVLSALRKSEEALSAYDEALLRYRRLAESQPEFFAPDVAMTLNNLGNAFSVFRQINQAVDAYDEALLHYRRLARSQPEVYEPDVAMTLNNLGNVLRDLRRLDKALVAYEEALQIRRRLAEAQSAVVEPDLMGTLHNCGTVLRTLRRLDEALVVYQEAFEIRRRLMQKQPGLFEPDEALALINWGNALRDLWRLDEARVAYDQALLYYRRLAAVQPRAFEPDLAMTLNNLGNLLRDAGRLTEARAAYDEALLLYRRLAQEQSEVYAPDMAMTLNNLGNVLRAQRRLGEAHKAYDDALKIRRRLAHAQPEAYGLDVAATLNNLGTVLNGLQRSEEALAAFDEALVLFRRSARSQSGRVEPDEAMTLSNLGSALYDTGKIDEARAAYREALRLYNAAELVPQRLITLRAYGAMEFATKQTGSAIELLEEAHTLIELLNAEALTTERRMQIRAENARVYALLTNAYVERQRGVEALEVWESGKGRVLGELMMDAENLASFPVALRQEYRRARTAAQQLATPPDWSGIAPESRPRLQEEYTRQRTEAFAHLQRLVGEMRERNPDFQLASRPVKFAQISALATQLQATLVSFCVTDHGTHVFLIQPSGQLEIVSVPSFTAERLNELLVRVENDAAVSGWLGDYWQAQRQPSMRGWLVSLDETLKQLYASLLQPVNERLRSLQGGARLILIPTRGLALLPLHAAWWEDNGARRYLCDDYGISYAPSLTVLQRCVEREADALDLTHSFGVCNPTLDLRYTEWECAEIERQWGVSYLRGAQASAAAVLEQAAGAHLLHFSCHCTANLAEPLKSSLRLANDETLSLGNILQQLNLSQNWLTILSACETNQADFHQANDEHLSLATGVVLAGAATVWSTLWAVNDASAALLLIEAMRRLGDNGGDKPAALQAAQQWLRTATVGDVIPLLNERIQQLPFNKLRTTLINLREQMLDAEHPQWMPFSHPYHWAAWQSVGS